MRTPLHCQLHSLFSIQLRYSPIQFPLEFKYDHCYVDKVTERHVDKVIWRLCPSTLTPTQFYAWFVKIFRRFAPYHLDRAPLGW